MHVNMWSCEHVSMMRSSDEVDMPPIALSGLDESRWAYPLSRRGSAGTPKWIRNIRSGSGSRLSPSGSFPVLRS